MAAICLRCKLLVDDTPLQVALGHRVGVVFSLGSVLVHALNDRRYIGMEYIRTNNIAVSEKYLLQAKAICSADPLVLNELGVVVR